jgi:hypothetical protein
MRHTIMRDEPNKNRDQNNMPQGGERRNDDDGNQESGSTEGAM